MKLKFHRETSASSRDPFVFKNVLFLENYNFKKFHLELNDWRLSNKPDCVAGIKQSYKLDSNFFLTLYAFNKY